MSAKYATVLTENAGSNLRILANNVSIQTWNAGTIPHGASLTQVLHNASNVTAMTIADGNVGIGTTIPRAPLDIQGNIRFTGDLLRNGQPFTTAWVTSGDTVYIGAGSNLAVGTNNAQGNQLYVDGDGQITGSLTVADLTVLNQSFINGDNAAVRSMIQIHPVRKFFRVTNSNQNTFTLPMDGVAEADDIDAEVFLNGVKLAYQTSNIRDFIVNYAYPTASNTIFTVNLTQPALYDDILDITVWPKFPSTQATMQPGYVYQQFSSLWNVDSGNVYFDTGYVGIGTDLPSHTLEVSGSVRINSMSSEVFTKSLSVDTNNATNICTVQSTYGAFVISLDVIHSELGSSMSKTYAIACRNNMTNGNWFRVNPINSSGRDGTQDFAVDVMIASTTATLRLVRTSGVAAVADNFKCIVRVSESGNDPVFINDSNTTAMTVSVSGVLDSTPLGMNLGNVGIGTTNPRAKMHVWQTGTGDAIRVDDALNDTTPFIITDGGNVGVGTATPLAKMHVVNTDNSDVFRVDDVAADTTPMIVDRTGNVGYGTAPAVAMHMEKDVGGASMELRMKNKTANTSSGSKVVLGWENTANTQFYNLTMGVGRGTSTLLNTAGTSHIAELSTVQDMPMLFGTNSTEKMRIQSDGNVGIGVAAPTEKLEVSGNIRASGNMFAGGTITASNLNIIGDTVTLNTTTSNTEQLVVNNAGTGPALRVIQSGANTVADFVDSETGSALFIANGGNVGMGTMNPTAKLRVEGDLFTTGSIATFGNLNIGNNATGAVGIEMGQGRTTNGSTYVDLITDPTYTDYGLRMIRYGASGGSNADADIVNRGTGVLGLKTLELAPIALTTGNTERMRVAADGNVGIGTITPSELFHVAKDVAGATTMHVVNQSVSTAALATVSARTNLTTSETRIGTLGSGFTTNGAFVASGGFLEAGAGLSGGMSILSTHASGAIRLYTAGSAAANKRMEIDANGKVLVATTATTGTVNIGAGSGLYPYNLYLEPTTHATSKRAGLQMGEWLTLQDSMGDGVKNFALYQLGTANTTRLYISPSGNVGINTTNPRGLLTIGGGDVLGQVDGSGNPWIQGVSMKVNSTAVADRRFYSVGQSDTNNVSLGWVYNATAASGYGVIDTYGGSNALVLQSVASGNVGIGTTTPGYKLSVNVNDTSVVQHGIVNADTNTGRAGIMLKAGTNSGFFLQQGASGGAGVLENYGAGGIGLYAKTATGTHNFFVGDANTRAMIIANSGNVGLSTSATFARLTINPAVTEPKICLWGDGTNQYGFGVSGNQLNYHTAGSSDRHVFYLTGNNGNGTELVRFSASGAVFSTGISFSGSLAANASDTTARQSAGLYVATDRSHGMEYQSQFSRWNTSLLTSAGFTFKKVSATYSSTDAGTNMVIIDGNGNVGIGTTGNLTAGLHINTNHMNGMLVETDLKTFPPAAMTADTTTLSSQTFGNGTYIAAASSIQLGDNPWKVFDKSTGTIWHSASAYTSTTGVYTGSVSTTAGGTSYNGEWIQIQLPVSVRLISTSIQGRQDGSLFQYRSPRTFYILGSQDGITWNLLFSQVDKTDWTSTAVSFNMTTTTEAYKFFRMVVTRIGNFNTTAQYQDICNICEWGLTGQIVTMTAKDGDIGVGMLNPTVPLQVQGDSILVGKVGIGTTTSPSVGVHLRVDQNTRTTIFSENYSTGAGAWAEFSARNASSNSGTRMGTLGTSWITTGGFVQNGGFLDTEATLAGGLSIMSRHTTSGIMRFYTAGSADANERMRIDIGGNIGIGTNNPVVRFHVLGSSAELVRVSDGTRDLYMGCDANDPWFGTRTNHSLRIVTNGTEKVRVLANGNVGIGQATPAYALDVNGTVSATSFRGDGSSLTGLSTQWTSSGTNAYFNLAGNVGIGQNSPGYKLDVTGQARFTQSAAATLVYALSSGATAGQNINLTVGKATSTNNTANFRYTHGADGSSTNYVGIGFWGNDDILNVAASGNVGIGTTNPTSRFVVRTSHSDGITVGTLFTDATTYPRIGHTSADGTVAAVYQYTSGKNVYWGEDADTGYYYFRGREVIVNKTIQHVSDTYHRGNTYYGYYDSTNPSATTTVVNGTTVYWGVQGDTTSQVNLTVYTERRGKQLSFYGADVSGNAWNNQGQAFNPFVQAGNVIMRAGDYTNSGNNGTGNVNAYGGHFYLQSGASVCAGRTGRSANQESGSIYIQTGQPDSLGNWLSWRLTRFAIWGPRGWVGLNYDGPDAALDVRARRWGYRLLQLYSYQYIRTGLGDDYDQMYAKYGTGSYFYFEYSDMYRLQFTATTISTPVNARQISLWKRVNGGWTAVNANTGMHANLVNTQQWIVELDSVWTAFRVLNTFNDNLFHIAHDSGNVGINNSAPGRKLDVNGDAYISNCLYLNNAANNTPALSIADNSSWDSGNSYGTVNITRASNDTTRAHLALIRNGNMVWQFGYVYNTNTLGVFPANFSGSTTATPTMSWMSGGNVGIGISAPSNKLDVGGSCRVAGNLKIDFSLGYWDPLFESNSLWGDGLTTASDYGGTRYGGLRYSMLTNPHVTTSSAGANCSIRIGRGGGVGTGRWWEVATRTDSKFHIGLEGTGTSGIVIDTAAQLGIGNDSPSYKLDVYLNSAADVMRVQNAASTGYATIRYQGDGTNLYMGLGGSGVGTYANKGYAVGPSQFVFGGMTVGVNTTSPSYTLDVNGSAIIRDWVRTVGNCGWYSETHGGGMWMQDSTWVRVYNGKGLYGENTIATAGSMGAGTSGPWTKLHVIGDISFPYGSAIRVEPNQVSAWPSGTTYLIYSYWNGATDAVNYYVPGSQRGAALMTMLATGRIGVNRTDPGYTFDVSGSGRYTGNLIWDANGTNYIGNGNSDSATMSAYNFRIRSWWGIGFPSFDDVNRIVFNTRTGEISCTGDITAFASASDIRLKDNVTDLGSAMDILTALRPVTFTWKKDMFNKVKCGSQDAGFIAQEVEPLLPHLMKTIMAPSDEGTEYKGIAYEKLTPYLVKGVQELNEELKNTNNELQTAKEELQTTKDEVKSLTQQMENLKALVAQLLQK